MKSSKRYSFLFTTMLVLISLMINLISPVMNVFALDANKNISLSISSNKNPIKENDEVKFIVNYSIKGELGTLKDGGNVITFNLPDGFRDVKPSYPKDHFDNVTVEGTKVVATLSEKALTNGIGGYLSIRAFAPKVDEDKKVRVEASLDGDSTYLDVDLVNTDPVIIPDEKPDHNPIGDRLLHKYAQNASYYTDGIPTANIPAPAVGKRWEFFVSVNEKYSNLNNVVLKDKMPNGLELDVNSLKIEETPYIGSKKDVTKEILSKTEKTKDGLVINFGDINSRYDISYYVNITEEFPTYKNTAILNENGNTIESSSMLKTEKVEVPMIKKYENTKFHDKKGNSIVTDIGDEIGYTLVVNQNGEKIKNAVINDILPQGTKYKESSASIYYYDSQGSYQFDPNSSDKVTVKDNKMTIKLGDIKDKYLIYYRLVVTDKQEEYKNKAIISYDDETSSSNSTVKYEKDSGSINAIKKVDKKTLKDGDNQIVNYSIEIDSHGFFSDGYIDLSDNINPDVKIVGVNVEKHKIIGEKDGKYITEKIEDNSNGISLKVDKVNNKIEVANDSVNMNYDEIYKVNIKTDFTNVKDGTTILNVAKIKDSSTNTVETKKGYAFKALKVDKKTKKLLSEARFNILDKDKKVIGTVTSNEDGVIREKIVTPGTYYLKEIKAPKGYYLNNDYIKFTIKEDDLGTTIDLGYIYNNKMENDKNSGGNNTDEIVKDPDKTTGEDKPDEKVKDPDKATGEEKPDEKVKDPDKATGEEKPDEKVKDPGKTTGEEKPDEKVEEPEKTTEEDKPNEKVKEPEKTTGEDKPNEIAKENKLSTNDGEAKVDKVINEKSTNVNKSQNYNNPKTYDVGIAPYVGVGILAMSGLVINTRRKK
ncbi:SpaA isopeptide-forming pilin-related protein [[Clostridium] dakarense]|uniref:SpaA isopeptide-forming pilin-related protein n=1 Tax=Faecalimicrobium dakarense TaxID=1301100 RepID=UPI0008DB4B19|nr:SpaA isopeptide-forming pilin-related protein [[Clostridium] dakarense]